MTRPDERVTQLGDAPLDGQVGQRRPAGHRRSLAAPGAALPCARPRGPEDGWRTTSARRPTDLAACGSCSTAGDPVLAPGVYDAPRRPPRRGGRLRRRLHDGLRYRGVAARPSRRRARDHVRDGRQRPPHRARRSRCRSSPTPTPATATRSTSCARSRSTSGPASRRSTSRTRCRPSAAGTWRASRSSRPTEMLAKIRAAVAARRVDPDLVIIARTDARAVEGLAAAIDRARALPRRRRRRPLRRGADERGRDRDRRDGARRRPPAVQLGRRRQDAPDPVRPARTPSASRIVIFPISALLTATGVDPSGVRRDPAAARTPIPIMDRIPRFAEFLGLHRPARDG